MAEQTVTISVVETTRYSREFTLSELEQAAGVTLEEAGSLDALADAVYLADNKTADYIKELVERHGDVYGQVWTGQLASSITSQSTI